MSHGPNGPHLRPEELVGALHDRDPDEFDVYLAERLKDPQFRDAYERAEWINARWWRRLLNRWGWLA